ncbi:hypothetical protein AV530_000536 [Patagioenas fasciata monilis]|uniref:Uncharacterized protein n=1 Tax=Patagioenas fasciata monilis TaxID=372326 RepID=A0A1V4IFL5_PATFA|nr:hypothetical protein AV530_000536 [Patagioenas fasciata monilis]
MLGRALDQRAKREALLNLSPSPLRYQLWIQRRQLPKTSRFSEAFRGLPGEGMGVVIRCHPPVTREESLSQMKPCVLCLTGVQTFWASQQQQHSPIIFFLGMV